MLGLQQIFIYRPHPVNSRPQILNIRPHPLIIVHIFLIFVHNPHPFKIVHILLFVEPTNYNYNTVILQPVHCSVHSLY